MEDAIEMLEKNLSDATAKLAESNEDLAHLKDQITTVEVRAGKPPWDAAPPHLRRTQPAPPRTGQSQGHGWNPPPPVCDLPQRSHISSLPFTWYRRGGFGRRPVAARPFDQVNMARTFNHNVKVQRAIKEADAKAPGAKAASK